MTENTITQIKTEAQLAVLAKYAQKNGGTIPSIQKTAEELKKERMIRNLLQSDMAQITPYLDDPLVTDVAVVDSGELIVTRFGKGREFTGIHIPDYMVERIIRATAAIIGKNLESWTGFPVLEGIIPKYSARITGLLQPVTLVPQIQIRKPPRTIYSLEQYVQHSQMTKAQYVHLVKAIEERKNILVTGSTGSGKTTCTNAIIKKMEEFTPHDNFYIVEDVPELQCRARMKTQLWIEKNLAYKAVEESLRFSPDRIIFGEVRTPQVMVELLDAWKTGHSGNVTTLHANNARAALMRIQGMLGKEGSDTADHLSEVIQLIIHLRKTPEGVRMDEIMDVDEGTDHELQKSA